MLKRIGYSLSVSLSLMLMTSSPTLAKNTARVTVGVAEDWQQGIETSLYCQGSTPFYQTISSHAHASVKWLLPVGSHVQKGTVLAQQDDFYLRQQLAQIDTDIAIVEARHQFAESELERLQSMTVENMVAPSEFQRVKLEYQSAQLRKVSLEQQRQTLHHQLLALTHVAPGEGIVTRLQVEPGTWVPQGQAILAFLPIQQQEITCQVDASWYQQVTLSHQLQFSIDQQPLTLIRQGAMVSEREQTLAIHLVPTAPLTSPIRVGQRYAVTLSQVDDGLVSVPYDALLIEQQQAYVWRVNTNPNNNKGEVEKVAVTVVATQDEMAIIQSAITTDDEVVISGKKGLSESLRVVITESES